MLQETISVHVATPDRSAASFDYERRLAPHLARQVDTSKIIIVRSALDGAQVALWEKHPSHPEGAAFVAGATPVRVAKTPAVVEKLNVGAIIEVSAAEARQAEQKKRAADERRLAAEREAERERRRKLYIAAIGNDREFDRLYRPAA